MKKLCFLFVFLLPFLVEAQQRFSVPTMSPRAKKKIEKQNKINELIKREEEGALIFDKQGAFGFKFNTDGWGMFYERGKYKTLTKTNLWWIELGEHKHKKEEKIPSFGQAGGFLVVSSYIYGKRNNFFVAKLGLGQQKLIGGKGNKNGVAVSAIYGGGFSAGLLKPYYIEINDVNTSTIEKIKYNNNDNLFLDPAIIIGNAGLGKGLNEIDFVPGVHVRTALRFDYGRYNEVISAMEVGLNAEYYSKKIPILLLNKENQLFFNAYIALIFGKRK